MRMVGWGELALHGALLAGMFARSGLTVLVVLRRVGLLVLLTSFPVPFVRVGSLVLLLASFLIAAL